MSRGLPPRSVFGQLALVIGLVLLGAFLLAGLLGREMATRPAGEQLLRAMDSFAAVAERLAGTHSVPELARMLRDAGLEVRETPPARATPRWAPLLEELREQAPDILGAGRELRVGRNGQGRVIWLKLDTAPPLWVSFSFDRRGQGVRRFSAAMLIGCVLLVWLAAAFFARRLVQPLRQLAMSAPDIVRGESPLPPRLGGPREVRELAQALDRSGQEVRAAAEDRAVMLAGISHDLRTPLTRVQFALELLPDTDPELRAGMERDIGEIDAILAQFIAYARDGRDEASEPLDLAAICRSAASAADPGWQLELPVYAPMSGKPMALLRAVENLMVNAQRHGAPPYSLRLSGQPQAWRLEVIDGGPGLPAELGDRIRQPFVHGGDSGGAGLGLAIAERVARQHGGDLAFSPHHPRGLVVTMRLRGTDLPHGGQ